MARIPLSADAVRSTTDSPPLDSSERWLWGLVAFGFALDVTLTLHGLRVGLEETNPIARSLFPTLGVVNSLLFLKSVVVVVGIGAWIVLPQRFRSIVPLGLALPWLVASIINVSLILRVV